MNDDTEIFYFSGTRNSLVVARDFAKRLQGRIVPIPFVINKPTIHLTAEKIDVIFPVYFAEFGDVPRVSRTPNH